MFFWYLIIRHPFLIAYSVVLTLGGPVSARMAVELSVKIVIFFVCAVTILGSVRIQLIDDKGPELHFGEGWCLIQVVNLPPVLAVCGSRHCGSNASVRIPGCVREQPHLGGVC
uniref:Uncharacterized protein n=1 Tax=Ixodes ricinus TaxID=34613 RepID=A0A6B0UK33_IXORI